MKNYSIIVFICVFVFFSNISGQSEIGISGKWQLDVEKSRLEENISKSIKVMTMTIVYNGKDLKVETYLDSNIEIDPLVGGIFNMSGNSKSGKHTEKFIVDGKERTIIVNNPPLQSYPVKQKVVSKRADELEFTKILTFNFGNDPVSLTIRDNWKLIDGNTLQIKQEVNSVIEPEETRESIWIFKRIADS